MRRSILPLLVIIVAFHATPAGKFALTVDNITRGPGLYGYEPSQVRWSGDGERVYFQWKLASDPREKDPDTYVVGRDGAGLRKLSEAEAKLAPPAFGSLSKDKRHTVYARDGDVFVHDMTTGQTQQITKTSDTETNPRFTRDGKRVAFTRANNLYVMSLDTGLLEQLTDIRLPAAAGAPAQAAGGGGRFGQGQGGRAGGRGATATEEQKGTESQEYLKKEERDLLQVIRERAAKREEEEARKKRENPRKPFNLQTGQTITSLELAPDEKYVIAGVMDPGTGVKNTIVPNYVTESVYTEDIASRNKVGDNQGRVRLAMLTVETGEVKWIDHGQKAPPAANVEAKTNGNSSTDVPPAHPAGTDRDVQLSMPLWSEDGTHAVIQARAADNKDRWILALDQATGKTRVLVHDHDDAWVDGPGSTTLGWMKGDREIYFQSERTGYSHLYTVSFDGGEAKALTSGKWEVISADLSRDKSRFFLVTNEPDPAEHNVYEMSAEGGARIKLTSLPGGHTCVLSPDDRWFADLYSYTNKPPELYVQEARAGVAAKKLTSSPSADFWEYPWIDAPLVTIAARDGAQVRARLYKPATFHKGGPAVIFVHGAGYLQNVHHWWSAGYAREYLFHHLLMERGYMAIDIDYRGSAGYGRDWRTAIYRHMGGKDLDDHVDAAKWLVAQHGVDPKRIGIYGGSYGGFITLMAMFTQPDVFAAGAALRPVTDWASYNHPYTSNILNVPQKDAEAYRLSSPIYFAQGLKGALLICHGMVDTNVHFQDTVRLVQRLIELRKENWELAVYPVENHGFVEPTSWADEYKRILDLFEKNLKPHA
jgi:dipeptidyl aminopeptidase/acylaminoacyl peptidase